MGPGRADAVDSTLDAADRPVQRRVILSPHPDDAVWSLGGAIAAWARHGEVLVVTVFDGEPPDDGAPAPSSVDPRARVGGSASRHDDADPAHRWRGLGAAPRRQQEDAVAIADLGAKLLPLGLREAAFRQEVDGRFSHSAPASLFASVDPGQWPDPSPALLERLRAVLRPDDLVIAPLAVGRHVDHCLVHRAARQLVPSPSFYMEFPYAETAEGPAVQQHLDTLGLRLGRVRLPVAWSPWVRAASRYRSQVLRLFGSGRVFAQQLARFAGVAADVAGAGATGSMWVVLPSTASGIATEAQNVASAEPATMDAACWIWSTRDR
ncbi:PIG-L deacetylase family protein [Roseateles amylovorans]|uniref:PIG-L family deacetylase n=1 Tax=Roseateles amylovorans TaxID=2978473 RepID=A0ABY6AUX5_9BURK|nr:PIG-L family deacetylase [Roseateles amylovorans]UXH76108.1 PIG-L family deacetylase [Roseateles amylovorans]